MRLFSVFLLLVSISFFSCENKEKEIQTIGKPHLVDVYPEGETKEIRSYINEDSTAFYQEIYHKNGKLSIKGLIVDDSLRVGEWKAWSKNSQLLTIGNYEDGTDHGLKTVFYPNGNKRYEGKFLNGERVGVWKFWSEDGELIKEIEY